MSPNEVELTLMKRRNEGQESSVELYVKEVTEL